jgi:hypothetical protein
VSRASSSTKDGWFRQAVDLIEAGIRMISSCDTIKGLGSEFAQEKDFDPNLISFCH